MPSDKRCCEDDCPNPGAVYVNASKVWCVHHYWMNALRHEVEIIAEGVYQKHKPGRKGKAHEEGQG